MKLKNLKCDQQVVDYATAVRTGLGQQQGLFFPPRIPVIEDLNQLLSMPTTERNYLLLRPLVKENLDGEDLQAVIDRTFTFDSPLVAVGERHHCLELFHGPTLAFKDFGARFMANCLQHFAAEQGPSEKITILTATSGDTGAAVAHAFHGLAHIDVVVLFPAGKISTLQQKMFTTLADNIRTVAIDGDFDDCQKMVKRCFDDQHLVKSVGLNSANSINVSRLFAQICYYFDAMAQLPEAQRNQAVFAVPSGNFGNLCAGIIARTMGLPIKRFVASTNLNDTVPRFLQDGIWAPNDTVETLSNAMDVSRPNNWPRIQYLIDSGQFDRADLSGLAVNEQQTAQTLMRLHQAGYVSEPHAAVAYHSIENNLADGETGIFLGTAHPAKFKDTVEDILDLELRLPQAIADCAEKPDLSTPMAADYATLKSYLLR